MVKFTQMPRIILVFLIFELLLPQIVLAQTNPCTIDFEGIDLETKTFKKQLAARTIIQHTPPQLKNDLQQKDLIIGTAFIYQHEQDFFLHLSLKINSPKAQSLYGFIPDGSQMKITTVNNDEVLIRIPYEVQADMQPDRAAYTYYINAPLDSKTRRQLQKSEIDKWGFVFSSGYEEYVIYQVDFFIDQIGCLSNG